MAIAAWKRFETSPGYQRLKVRLKRLVGQELRLAPELDIEYVVVLFVAHELLFGFIPRKTERIALLGLKVAISRKSIYTLEFRRDSTGDQNMRQVATIALNQTLFL